MEIENKNSLPIHGFLSPLADGYRLISLDFLNTRGNYSDETDSNQKKTSNFYNEQHFQFFFFKFEPPANRAGQVKKQKKLRY